ncbi:MAG: hypothetical protein WC980_05780 [Candidatus Brocadiia bacterium]
MPDRHIIWLLVFVILVTALAPAQEPNPAEPTAPRIKEIGQNVTNWSYAHYQDDKLLWESRGRTAVIRGENNVTVQGLEMIYYPESGVTPTDTAQPAVDPGRVLIHANEAVIRKNDNFAALKGAIIAQWEKKNNLGGTDITNKLTAEELAMDMASKVISSTDFVSITHWLEQPSGESGVVKEAPHIFITGKGFTGQSNLEAFSFHQLIQVRMSGLGFSPLLFNQAAQPAGDSSASGQTTIAANDSMIAVPASFRQENDSRRISFTGQVVLTQGPTKLYTDHLEVLVVRTINPQTKLNEYMLNNTRAFGGVRIESQSTVSGSDWSASSDTFIRDDIAGTVVFTATENTLANLKTSTLNFVARTLYMRTAQNILTLKGEKRVVLEAPISGTSDTSRINITAKDDIQAYMSDGRIVFQNSVRMNQDQNPVSGTEMSILGQLEADKLVLSFDPISNTLSKMRADGNVMIMGMAESWAQGECLEWSPETGQINIKSNHKVKVWHNKTLVESDEIIIFTSGSGPTQIGQWDRIEAKVKEGGSGVIKVSPPK